LSLSGGQNAAHKDLLNALWLYARIRQRRVNGDRSKMGRGDGRKCALKCAHGRAG
jgi:hypothetical protein